ncbi:hypothetical protein Tcan_09369, partial [Toxocara canis]
LTGANAWARNDSLQCWVITCFVFVAIAFCAMVGYPAFVIYLETQEKKNDDWKDNYLPEYPRVRWHLDEEMLEEEARNRTKTEAEEATGIVKSEKMSAETRAMERKSIDIRDEMKQRKSNAETKKKETKFIEGVRGDRKEKKQHFRR